MGAKAEPTVRPGLFICIRPVLVVGLLGRFVSRAKSRARNGEELRVLLLNIVKMWVR